LAALNLPSGGTTTPANAAAADSSIGTERESLGVFLKLTVVLSEGRHIVLSQGARHLPSGRSEDLKFAAEFTFSRVQMSEEGANRGSRRRAL
jgi:hypothetical protein